MIDLRITLKRKGPGRTRSNKISGDLGYKLCAIADN